MTESTPKKAQRAARLRWVSIEQMKVNPLAQREINSARVDRLANEFDLEQMGFPTVSMRDGSYFIIDGQHRIEALRAIGFGDESVQCQTYDGLSEHEEAEMFLKLNDYLAIPAIPKYRAALTAGRPAESDIDRILRSCGLVVSKDKLPGAVQAVGTLRRVYARSGPKVLGRTLRLIRDAYGDSGMEAGVIDGVGLLCQRYNGELDESVALDKLSRANGGVNGLLGKAETIRRGTGNQKNHCVAAAAVEIINSGKGGKKLPSWWKETA